MSLGADIKLGPLCPSGHEHEKTGKSLRYKSSSSCVACASALATRPRHRSFVDKNVFELAVDRVCEAYARFDRIVVSFSGGKDSTAALQVTLAAAKRLGKPPVEAFFWDEEAIYPKTVEYVERVAARPDVRLRWLAVPTKLRNACSRKEPFWTAWDPAKQDLWVRQPPSFAERSLPGFNTPVIIPETNRFVFPNTNESVGIVMGIRAQESLRRFMSVTHKTIDNWLSVEPLTPWCWLLKPIYDWGVEDVWTLPATIGCDYNQIYDDLTKIGMNRHVQRVSPPFAEEPLQNLHAYAVLAPEIWERMIGRVKGARTAARYARSPVYGIGKDASTELGTFEDQIKHELEKWAEPERSLIAKRIKNEIEYWNHHTKFAPIPAKADDPNGFCWGFLLQIARRGDLKGRKKAIIHTR